MLFLPHYTVKVGRTRLTPIDVGTRYKEAELLTSKGSKEAVIFEKIYSRQIITS